MGKAIIYQFGDEGRDVGHHAEAEPTRRQRGVSCPREKTIKWQAGGGPRLTFLGKTRKLVHNSEAIPDPLTTLLQAHTGTRLGDPSKAYSTSRESLYTFRLDTSMNFVGLNNENRVKIREQIVFATACGALVA